MATDGPPRIVVEYDAVDGVHLRGEFHTLRGARDFAQKWVGRRPELGRWYAISTDRHWPHLPSLRLHSSRVVPRPWRRRPRGRNYMGPPNGRARAGVQQ